MALPAPGLIATFVGLRSATGIAAWLAPTSTALAMGLGTKQQPLTTQLFGSRELTLAIAVATATSSSGRRHALQLGVLVDTLDIAAALRGIWAGTLSTTGLVVSGGGAALFAVMGVTALQSKVSFTVRAHSEARRHEGVLERRRREQL